MFDVDVHIIRYKEPDWMMDRCLGSLKGQPVNVHIVQGTKEFFPFLGREWGFRLGNAPFVSYVDPDDIVMPGAYEELLKHSDCDIVWGNEEVWRNGEVVDIHTLPHHAFIVRRGIPKLGYAGGAVPIYHATKRPGISSFHIDKILYRWNESEGQGYKTRERLNNGAY